MKKNCNNCIHLGWEEGDVGDPAGFVCYKKDLYGEAESKMLSNLERKNYREKAKKCCELKPDCNTCEHDYRGFCKGQCSSNYRGD